MNASRAWIVEEFVPEGPDGLNVRNRRSRFESWKDKMRRKKADLRPEHWCIIRVNRDPWEDVRRRDRLIMTEAMDAIRTLHKRHPRKTLRVRNIKTNDTIMGAVLCADLPNATTVQNQAMGQTAQAVPKILGMTGA